MSDEFNITIRGFSMEPYFHDGDVLLCRKKGNYKPNIGDIIVYRIKKRLICHRIVDICLPYIVTKGDNNMLLDAPIHLDSIIGFIEQKQVNLEVFVNDWEGKFHRYKELFEKDGIKYINRPDFIDDENYNILFSDSINRTIEKKVFAAKIKENIMIHIGAKLTDLESNNGLVRYDRFDRVISHRSFHSSICCTEHENIILIMDKVFLEKKEYFAKIYGIEAN